MAAKEVIKKVLKVHSAGRDLSKILWCLANGKYLFEHFMIQTKWMAQCIIYSYNSISRGKLAHQKRLAKKAEFVVIVNGALEMTKKLRPHDNLGEENCPTSNAKIFHMFCIELRRAKIV